MRRDARPSRYGEQKFVVFAAVQRLLHACAREAGRWGDIRGQTRSEAQAMQVERKAIADVHGRRRVELVAQPASQSKPGCGMQVALPSLTFAGREPDGRAAQQAGN